MTDRVPPRAPQKRRPSVTDSGGGIAAPRRSASPAVRHDVVLPPRATATASLAAAAPPPPPPPPPGSPPSFAAPTFAIDSIATSLGPRDSSASVHLASSLSTVSASAVSTATRRTASKSPRGPPAPSHDFHALVDALILRLHGVQTAMLARRTVVRLQEAPPPPTPMDPLVVLERIKRELQRHSADDASSSQRNARLYESYSRFIKSPGIAKKGEVLALLLSLMAPPAAAPSKSSAPAAVPSLSTSLDALEESFKSAVGLPSSSSAFSRPFETGNTYSQFNQSQSRASYSRESPRKATASSSAATAFDVPEQVLLRDVLYALQAIESRYIFFDVAADRFQITRSVGVPTPMRELIQRLCELGWLYRKINAYLQHSREDLAFGVVGQSFCHVLQLQLADYFRLVAVLAAQVDDDAETRRDARPRGPSDLTLRKLLVWVQDPLDQMRLLARLIDAVDGLRGGALASGVHAHMLHGDPAVRRSVQLVMKAVAAPIFRMIRRWVFEGELDDTHNEFFVTANPRVADDRLWTHKYQLNTEMLPSFISTELANRILVIGKSINFIRQCCGHSEWLLDARHHASVNATVDFEDNGVRFAQLSSLEAMIEQVSASTNEFLIRTLTDKYSLLDHCRALRRYMLLGQGDFIQYLMDLLRPELSKRATQVHRHTLMNVLETALNASNAKFESADILARLDVQLLRASSGDTGWDVFSLHYKVPSPINTVLNDAAMQQYQKIFHFLWKLKRVDHSLSTSWNKDMHLDHMIKRSFPEFRPLVHKCQLLRSEMIQFTTTLHNYVMFEVLETSWHKLVKDLKTAKDLDELIASHDEYIASIKEKGFMTDASKQLLQHLSATFDAIITFCRTQDNLYTTIIRHVDEANSRHAAMESRTARGTWGITEDDEAAEQTRRETFGPQSMIFRQIHGIGQEFGKLVGSLIQLLGTRTPSSLQSLSLLMIRFDFNEYYQNKTSPSTTEEAQ
ncbi:hypothetical protein PINS_up006315 [Pythium insidiosum]|nr:hypothetical protein PINS_up006315 [Pythium insidiosum]